MDSPKLAVLSLKISCRLLELRASKLRPVFRDDCQVDETEQLVIMMGCLQHPLVTDGFPLVFQDSHSYRLLGQKCLSDALLVRLCFVRPK